MNRDAIREPEYNGNIEQDRLTDRPMIVKFKVHIALKKIHNGKSLCECLLEYIFTVK